MIEQNETKYLMMRESFIICAFAAYYTSGVIGLLYFNDTPTACRASVGAFGSGLFGAGLAIGVSLPYAYDFLSSFGHRFFKPIVSPELNEVIEDKTELEKPFCEV
jgi:hypothetical protein